MSRTSSNQVVSVDREKLGVSGAKGAENLKDSKEVTAVTKLAQPLEEDPGDCVPIVAEVFGCGGCVDSRSLQPGLQLHDKEAEMLGFGSSVPARVKALSINCY
ncbi:hypothetical protein Droror1_Dr00027216, partial [Drosera rotundifolia]